MLETWYQPRQAEVEQMTAAVIDAEMSQPAGPPVSEHPARFTSGLLMLVGGVIGIIAGVVVIVIAGHQSGGLRTGLIVLAVLLFLGSATALGGLTPIQPGKARVVQLFGRYRGTIRESGLQWVNPFTKRIEVSTRIRNLESAQAKVNDADGNPIEIAAVVVWEVRDTAKAVYAVDNYTHFVTIQTETAAYGYVGSDALQRGARSRRNCNSSEPCDLATTRLCPRRSGERNRRYCGGICRPQPDAG
jgi:hypothetical protein